MPRKKKTTTKVEEELEPTAATPDELPEFGEIDEGQLPPDVMAVIAQVGGDVSKVTLFKRDRTGKQPYVGNYDAAEFDLETIKQEHGGGRYMARVYFTPSGGGPPAHRSFTFYIDETIKPLPPELRGRGSEMQDRLFERLLDKLDRPVGAQKDPMEIAAAFAQASATQMSATVAMLMPLFEKLGGGKGGSNIEELLSVMEFGIEHFGGKEEGYWPVIKEVGVPLVRALERGMGRGALTAPIAAVLPENPGAPPWVPTVRAALKSILPYMQANRDPALVAATLDLQAPRMARWLEGVVTDPTFRGALLQHVPEVAPYAAWLDRFLAEFLLEGAEPESEVVEPADEE